MTPDHWARLSPLLDELLDLDDPARAARLAALRTDDPALAEELSALLAQDAALDKSAFLALPALPDLAALTAARERAGDTVGAYTLEAVIGEGGMGSVWRARRSDGRFEGQVAIKFLRSGLQGAGDAGRFAREGAILARLAHPHIARLLDAGVTSGGNQPYLVLEYVDGAPIDRWCETRRLGTRGRVRLLLDVLAAVAHAHNRLILHRDLKPSNILVGPDGSAKLLDFGIAKLLDDSTDGGAPGGAASELTQRAGAAYTPHYAAPEQVQGGEVTTATDVYALGVLMYGLLGGGHPTTESTAAPMERLRTVVEVEPRRLSDAVRLKGTPKAARRARELRGDLDTIVAKALKKKPAERYANAATLADDLQRWLRRQPITARPDSAAYRMTRFAQRHRVSVAAGLLVLLSLSGGLGAALWQGHEARRQRAQAEALVEFMLGDLREKLEPVGRLDVLDAVGDKVLQHYAALAGSGADTGVQSRRAHALLLLGAVAEKRRELDRAQQRYEQAVAITEAQLAREPDDAEAIAAHVDALGAVADLRQLRGQRDALSPLLDRLRLLVDRLRRITPDQPDARWQDAMLHRRQGVVQMDTGALEAAQAEFSAAEVLLGPVVAAQPERAIDLAQLNGYLSRVLELRNDLGGAVARMQAKADVLRRMPDAGHDIPVQVDLVAAASEVARLRQAMGENDAAARSYDEALERSDALLAHDDSNQMWQRQGINLRINLGQLALARGDWAAAAPLNAQVLARLARVLEQPQPERFFRLVLLGHALAQRGELALGDPTHHDRAQASSALAGYLADVQRVEVASQALDVNELRALGLAQLTQGDLLAATGQADAARVLWQQAATRLSDAPAQRDYGRMLMLGEARLRLGDRAGAQALADAVAAQRPKSLPLALLRQRLETAASAVALGGATHPPLAKVSQR